MTGKKYECDRDESCSEDRVEATSGWPAASTASVLVQLIDHLRCMSGGINNYSQFLIALNRISDIRKCE